MSLYAQEVINMATAGTVFKELLPAGDKVDWAKRSYFRKNFYTTSKKEYKRLREKADRLEPGQGFYLLKSDCGFLAAGPDDKSICTVHDDPALKPYNCEKFTEGGIGCRAIRTLTVEKVEKHDYLIGAELPDIELAKIALNQTSLANFDQSFAQR